MTSFLASHHHILEFALNALRACITLAIVVALFAPLERLFAVRPAKLFQKGWLTNLGWYFFNSLITALLLAPPATLIAWIVHSLLPAASRERLRACRYGRAWSRHGRRRDRLLLGPSLES